MLESIGLGLGIANTAMDLGFGLFNLGRQREQRRYDRALQERMFQREDFAIRRRVEDMRLAGLSPVLAAGQGSSAGPVVKQQSPQMGPVDSDKILQNVMDMKKLNADITHTKAQNKLLANQAEKTKEETSFMRDMNPKRLEEKDLQNKFSRSTIIERMEQESIKLKNMKRTGERLDIGNEILRLEKELKVLERDIQEKFGFDNASMKNLMLNIDKNIKELYDKNVAQFDESSREAKKIILMIQTELLKQTRDWNFRAGSKAQQDFILQLLNSLAGFSSFMKNK